MGTEASGVLDVGRGDLSVRQREEIELPRLSYTVLLPLQDSGEVKTVEVI